MKGKRFMMAAGALMVALALGAAPRAVTAQGIVNGDFETGNFDGWTATLHDANPPASPPAGSVQSTMFGAQVLTGDDISQNGELTPPAGVSPPQGRFFALISTMPSVPEDEQTNPPGQCPTTKTVLSPYDVDQDGFKEFDVTTLTQDFVVDQLPATLSFAWSFLNSEGDTELHDDFQVTITPIDQIGTPTGPAIQVLGVTAGNCKKPPYAGTFECINNRLDHNTYEVITDPPGEPTDCHYSDMGRSPFQTTAFAIPAGGRWRVTFYVGDDGGDDAGMDSGVLLDQVQVVTGAPVPALSRGGVVGGVFLLLAVGIFGVARRTRVRGQAMHLVLLIVFLGATFVVVTPAAGSLPESWKKGSSYVAARNTDNDQLAVRRAPRRPTPNPTRQPSQATPTPQNSPDS